MFKKVFLLIIFAANASMLLGQLTPRPLTGVTIYPRIVNVLDLPDIGQIEMGPEIRANFNEVEPPYMPPYPVPNAENLKHYTIDKGKPINMNYAPTTGVNFEGITQTTAIPSEPQPAAGPNNVVVLGNVSIKITDKSGTVLSNLSQSTFFGIPVAEGPGFDSKCYYDYRYQRFLLLCETQTTSPNVCKYYLAISATNSAMGTWYIYSSDMTKDGATQTTNWSDFPGLGMSNDKIVLSGQQFSFSGNQYQYQKLRILDRATAFAGGAVTYVDIVNWSSQVFVTKPSRNLTPTDTVYILATQYAGGTTIQFRRLTGPPSAPVLSAGTNVTVSSYGVPPDAPGGSGTVTVATGDCRTPDFFMRNGIIHLAFHAGLNFGGGATESAIKYVKIQVSPFNATPLTDENFGATDIFYYYPMVCADSVGTIFIGFGRSSATEFPSSWVTGKRKGEANIEASILAKTGVAVTAQSRWGDYSGIDFDQSASTNGVSYAWYAGQWTKGTNTFGTWVTQLSFTYAKIAGQVLDDADGDVSTTGDRTPVSNLTVTLLQGASTIATTTSDVSGNYSFGYLETANNYQIQFTPPAGKYSMDVIPGTGGNSQTKLNYKTINLDVSNSQNSTGNNILVSSWLTSIATGNWTSTATWADNITPSNTQKVFISSGNIVTINTDLTCSDINSKGVLQFDNFVLRNANISNSLILSNQSIQLGNNYINIGPAGTITGYNSTRYIVTNGGGYLTIDNVGATGKVFPVGIATTYNPVTINNTGTPDKFYVNVQSTFSVPPIDPTKVVNRLWTITENLLGGSNATVTLQYNTGDFPITFNNTSGNTFIGRHNGTNWEELSATWANPSSNVYTATASGFTQFSPFAIGNQGALPVILTEFSYLVNNRDVKLVWKTNSEIDNKGFEVERSIIELNNNKLNWATIGFVKGAGNSSIENTYTFEDKKMNSGLYTYRLKQIDYNHNIEYFNLNSNVTIGKPKDFDVSQNYPNPSNPNSKIDYQLPKKSFVSISVYDLLGKVVAELVNETKEPGFYTTELDGSKLSSGIYFYKIQVKNEQQEQIKIKKLVILK